MSYVVVPEARDTPTQKLLRTNWLLLILIAGLAAIGTATLYSVAEGSFQPWAEQHGVRFLGGIAVILIMVLVPTRIWMRAANPVYLAALALVIAVPFVGVEALGARRWLNIGGMSFQPTELMKVGLVLALARYYTWLPREKVSDPLWVAIPLLMIAVPIAFTLRQPDLGSAVLYGITGLALMFLAGVAFLYFCGGVVIAGVAAPLIYASLHDYQRKRVEIFLNPEADPLGAGYHITQSKIALGAGGFGGKGYMQGTQSQLDFLPEKHTDFIFTMFSEEWGFAGALGLLAIYVLVLVLLIRMAVRCQNMFGRLVVSGAAVTIFVYVFINVAMVTGIVPVVGVPLPFVSYGGTSMMTLMAALGLALSADVHSRERLREQELTPFI
jgi:rod shape determining protein RodA